MLTNVIAVVIFFAVAILLFWLLLRMRRRKNFILKWGGMAVFGLLAVLVSLITVLMGLGINTIYASRGNPVSDITVEATAEKLARGEHIAGFMCAACHTIDGELPLSGAENLLADIPIPLGSAMPPNLTPGGRIDEWSDGELIRAIREGTDPDGHRLVIMSAQTFRVFSQEDLESIVSYLRSQPEVTTDIEPEQQLSPVAMVMTTLGMLPVRELPDAEIPPAVPVGPTVEYGAYIAGFTDCAICHGDDLSGGTSAILPQGPNLVTVKSWTAEQFITTMRTGESPTRGSLDPDEMPGEEFGKLDDVELTAVYEYIKSVR